VIVVKPPAIFQSITFLIIGKRNLAEQKLVVELVELVQLVELVVDLQVKCRTLN
jgi:hypothetical protein